MTLEQVAFDVFGSCPVSQIQDWLDRYPENWIKQAMIATQAKKLNSMHYTEGILKGWAEAGGPPKKAMAAMAHDVGQKMITLQCSAPGCRQINWRIQIKQHQRNQYRQHCCGSSYRRVQG